MNKCFLVSSTYDRYKKSYSNEHYIKIEKDGETLNTLAKLDAYTASYLDAVSLLNHLREEGLIDEKTNSLCICKENSKQLETIRYSIIYNSFEIIETAQNLQSKRFDSSIDPSYSSKTRNDYFYTSAVEANSKAYLSIRDEIQDLLNQPTIETLEEELNTLYPNKYNSKQNYLVFFLKRYFTNSYNTAEQENHDLRMIGHELSRYTTFRGYISAKQRRKQRITSSNISSICIYKSPVNSIQNSKGKINRKTTTVTSKDLATKMNAIAAYENEFETEFEIKNGTNFYTASALAYNSYGKEDDKEEFLEAHEISQIDGFNKCR